MKFIKSIVAVSQMVAVGITLLVLTSCGDERKTYDDEGFLKSVISYKGDVPHGTATYYYKNGKIERKGQWKNGQMDGKWEFFCKDGQKNEEINFTNGLRNGLRKTLGCGSYTMHEYHYVLNDKGKSVQDGIERSWDLDNKGDWNSEGRLSYEQEYKMGREISYKHFAHNGSGKIVREWHFDTSYAFEGLCFDYSWETGDNLLRKGRWEKGRGVGIWVFWDKIKRCYKEIDCDKEKCDRDLWNGYDKTTYGFSSIDKYECKMDANADKIKNAASFDLEKNAEFTKDIDQVLKDVEKLQKEGKTVLGGKRDKADEDIGDGLAGLLGEGSIATKAKGSIKTPSKDDIDVSGALSTTDVLKIVRQRTPGLRHIYNKSRKKHPDLEGTVTLKLTIIEDGSISDISIKSSTTGKKDFDKEIKDTVSRWKFKKIDSGTTTVTMPFTFSE